MTLQAALKPDADPADLAELQALVASASLEDIAAAMSAAFNRPVTLAQAERVRDGVAELQALTPPPDPR